MAGGDKARRLVRGGSAPPEHLAATGQRWAIARPIQAATENQHRTASPSAKTGLPRLESVAQGSSVMDSKLPSASSGGWRPRPKQSPA